MKERMERDSMGEIRVPAEKYWGAQTQRSLQNFCIGKEIMPIEIIQAFAHIKKAAANANFNLGSLPENKKILIEKVCDEILSGILDDNFPLHVWQTGSGTQTNMNVNEVIANRAKKIALQIFGFKETDIHPNDHVNMSQSSNDTFPAAMNISACKIITEKTLPAISALMDALAEKSRKHMHLVKTGRTHMMDAVPLTLGQEFSGYVSQLDHGISKLEHTLEHLKELPLGGTAVGTGLNAPNGFAGEAIQHISNATGIRFTEASNKFEGIAAHDAVVSTHGAMKTIAVSLTKIAGDIRLLSSGPRCGIGELALPANEPGSSIMPGKVNPTQVEALTMVCAQIFGNDIAITFGGACGQLELNTFKPLIIHNFITSARLLADACNSFREKCIEGLVPVTENINTHVNRSLMLVTALNRRIGYEKAAEIAKKAHEEGLELKDAALELGHITEEEYDKIVNPYRMTGIPD